MMRFLFIVLLSGVFLFLGCKKAEYDSNPPNPPISVNNDTSIVLIDVYTLKGQSWVLYSYKVGDFGSMINHNDTLRFLSKSMYSFNKDTSTYSLTPSLSTFNLTLNSTFWGNLSGTIYEYNLKNGIIEGLKFYDITNGNNSSMSYFVWMKKI
jgi:hypothetical protein